MSKQQAEKAPPKPKPIAKTTLIVHDDGRITGDFFIWEENEVGKKKIWTVSGEDFFKYMNRCQPKNVRVIASAMNINIVKAGLPETEQGPWLRRNPDGTMSVGPGSFVENSKPPVAGAEHGKRIAADLELKAAKDIGLDDANAKAAVPDAQPSATAVALPTPRPVGEPAVSLDIKPGKK